MSKTAGTLPRHSCFQLIPFLLMAFLASSSVKNDHESYGLPEKTGIVVAVYDGDTIKVRFIDGSERRVRLIGIDTPEIDEKKEQAQLEAQLAKRFVFHYLYQKPVELTYEQELEDKYGRLLAFVWTEQGLFNEFILKQGFARAFLAFSHDLREKFILSQEEAREKGRGFWQKMPYPLVSGLDIRDQIGQLRRLRFVCGQATRRGNFLFLNPESREFSVLIPQENIPFFPGWKSWEGSMIEASGFVEEYKGQPQIMVFFPLQLKVLDSKK